MAECPVNSNVEIFIGKNRGIGVKYTTNYRVMSVSAWTGDHFFVNGPGIYKKEE